MHHLTGAAQWCGPKPPRPSKAIRRRQRRTLSLRSHRADATAGRTSLLYSFRVSPSLVGPEHAPSRSTLLAQPLALPYGVKIEAARGAPSGGLVDAPLLPRPVQIP